jgi:hypothetical protein
MTDRQGTWKELWSPNLPHNILKWENNNFREIWKIPSCTDDKVTKYEYYLIAYSACKWNWNQGGNFKILTSK